MEKLITNLAKHFAGLIVLTQLVACSPARYTYLKKVKVETESQVMRESVSKIELASAATESKSWEAGLKPVEEPVLLADNSKEVKAHHVLRMVSRSGSLIKSRLLEKHLDTKTPAQSKAERKAYTERPYEFMGANTQAVDYNVSGHHGFLWSLVAAVLIVWLIGVLFTNVGGFVHVLLGVALVLVVLDLLA